MNGTKKTNFKYNHDFSKNMTAQFDRKIKNILSISAIVIIIIIG